MNTTTLSELVRVVNTVRLLIVLCVVFLQELGKNLFKRRRVLTKQKRKKHLIVGAVVDKGLITKHHLKKRRLVSYLKLVKYTCHCCHVQEVSGACQMFLQLL